MTTRRSFHAKPGGGTADQAWELGAALICTACRQLSFNHRFAQAGSVRTGEGELVGGGGLQAGQSPAGGRDHPGRRWITFETADADTWLDTYSGSRLSLASPSRTSTAARGCSTASSTCRSRAAGRSRRPDAAGHPARRPPAMCRCPPRTPARAAQPTCHTAEMGAQAGGTRTDLTVYRGRHVRP